MVASSTGAVRRVDEGPHPCDLDVFEKYDLVVVQDAMSSSQASVEEGRAGVVEGTAAGDLSTGFGLPPPRRSWHS